MPIRINARALRLGSPRACGRKPALPDGRDQLWVADITYVAIATGFVYLAVILDAWSRRVVGHALGRTIEVRLTLAALEVAIAIRRPTKGCIHHSDRGSQYAAQRYRLTATRRLRHMRQAAVPLGILAAARSPPLGIPNVLGTTRSRYAGRSADVLSRLGIRD